MANLVPIPWQSGYFLTPDTLAYLTAASNRLQTILYVNDAWRSYAEQKYYWDKYVAYLNGGPYAAPASNPDTGQRNHMRGAAFDLVRIDAATQAACRAVGLIRDADESWHWNNPNWANMPIIPTNTTTAGGGSTPLPPTKAEADMDKRLNLIVLNPKTGKDSGTRYWYGSRRGLVPIKSIEDYNLLARFEAVLGGKTDTINAEQLARLTSFYL